MSGLLLRGTDLSGPSFPGHRPSLPRACGKETWVLSFRDSLHLDLKLLWNHSLEYRYHTMVNVGRDLYRCIILNICAYVCTYVTTFMLLWVDTQLPGCEWWEKTSPFHWPGTLGYSRKAAVHPKVLREPLLKHCSYSCGVLFVYMLDSAAAWKHG